MKIIKISFPQLGWPLSKQKEPLLKQTPYSSGIWGDYKFIINSNIDYCDYWVVYDKIERNEINFCPSQNTLFITGEPPTTKEYDNKYYNQFAHIITCHQAIHHKNVHHFLQGQMWFINKTYDELTEIQNIKKSKEISIITSNKAFSQGHRKRLDFAHRIKEQFGDKIDLFGKGISEFEDKWEVLAPYKYSIVIENSCFNDYITEKLFDCYLSHTFPIYYGCTNISKYYDPLSYMSIDIDEFDSSVKMIERILEDKNHYQEKIPAIMEAKYVTMNKYNLFPLIINYIESKGISPDNKKECILIKEEGIHKIDEFMITIPFFYKKLFKSGGR
jgi:hypothetical protein